MRPSQVKYVSEEAGYEVGEPWQKDTENKVVKNFVKQTLLSKSIVICIDFYIYLQISDKNAREIINFVFGAPPPIFFCSETDRSYSFLEAFGLHYMVRVR